MFNYTNAWDEVDSSLVKAVYYNKPKRQMLVRLDGDKQYIYSNVDQEDARRIADAGSPGAQYNWWRRFRGKGNGGTAAHGEVVAPVEQKQYATVSGVTSVSGTVSASNNSWQFPATTSASGMTATFEVTYGLRGVEYKSVVTASDLVAAAQEVQSKLQFLGLNAVLTGVVRKN